MAGEAIQIEGEMEYMDSGGVVRTTQVTIKGVASKPGTGVSSGPADPVQKPPTAQPQKG